MPPPSRRGFSPARKAIARWFKVRSPGEELPCLTILLSLDRDPARQQRASLGASSTRSLNRLDHGGPQVNPMPHSTLVKGESLDWRLAHSAIDCDRHAPLVIAPFERAPLPEGERSLAHDARPD